MRLKNHTLLLGYRHLSLIPISLEPDKEEKYRTWSSRWFCPKHRGTLKRQERCWTNAEKPTKGCGPKFVEVKEKREWRVSREDGLAEKQKHTEHLGRTPLLPLDSLYSGINQTWHLQSVRIPASLVIFHRHLYGWHQNVLLYREGKSQKKPFKGGENGSV